MQLTPQDIVDAIALLDLAAKAGGLGAAEKALPLALNRRIKLKLKAW